jgi:phosphoheptose isomerase
VCSIREIISANRKKAGSRVTHIGNIDTSDQAVHLADTLAGSMNRGRKSYQQAPVPKPIESLAGM